MQARLLLSPPLLPEKPPRSAVSPIGFVPLDGRAMAPSAGADLISLIYMPLIGPITHLVQQKDTLWIITSGVGFHDLPGPVYIYLWATHRQD